MSELLGNHVESTRLLGRRTAELHRALSSRPEVSDFAPEPFTEFYRHGVYHGMLGLLGRTLETLRNRLYTLPPAAQDDSRSMLEREPALRARLHAFRDTKISGSRIRHHGDYHLGNVLYSGSDFIITNFEGDPNRPMSERRIKRPAFRDVTSMIRSFHYVSHAVLFGHVPGIIAARKDDPRLERWAQHWYAWISAVFLKGYLDAADGAAFLPATRDEIRILMEAYVLEKSLLEIQFELDHRPDWVRIPVHGILERFS
jgi:maltose alpha-D-glucosyltransferase/alpha-amylase